MWAFANIFTAIHRRFCLQGHNSDVVRAKEEEKVEEGGHCWAPVYCVGWGFLLAVWSRAGSAQRAGTDNAGWPRRGTQATRPQSRSAKAKGQRM